MEPGPAVVLLLGVACLLPLADSLLQISPSTLLIPSSNSVAQRREPLCVLFSCVEILPNSSRQRPHSNVVWMKDNEVIRTENNRKYRNYRKKKWLQINDLSYEDMGVYQCMFSVNDTERGTAELWIEPTISSAPSPQTVRVGGGEDVTVMCEVSGGKCDVVWSVAGEVIASSQWTNSSSNASRYTVLPSGSLRIRSGFHGDSNTYQCQASNKAGNATAIIDLRVEDNAVPLSAAGRPSLTTIPTKPPELSTQTLATPTSATSQLDPPPEMEEQEEEEDCVVLEDISFSLSPLTRSPRASTEDMYSENNAMNNVSKILPGTPSSRLSSGPAFLSRPPLCVQTTEGYTIDLPCVATGNPSPQVWWLRNGRVISGDESSDVTDGAETVPHYQILHNNTLRINTVLEDDAGLYKCMAENSIGVHWASTIVRVWGREDMCGVKVGGEEEGEEERVRRVTGGEQVTSAQELPWQVLIEYHSRLHSDHLCGGTLLRPDWLVTAAHCLHAGSQWISPDDLRVRVGVVNRSSSEPAQQHLQIGEIHIHPNYNLSFRFHPAPKYDIALLRLSQPARLTGSVRPACLPTASRDPPAGTLCSVSGWGHLEYRQSPSPSILHHTEVPTVNYSQCRSDNSYGKIVTRYHLCAGYSTSPEGAEGGTDTLPDTCQNDSGGPLVCKHSGRWRIFGVVNHGEGCGQPHKYGLYARVIKYSRWMKSLMNK